MKHTRKLNSWAVLAVILLAACSPTARQAATEPATQPSIPATEAIATPTPDPAALADISTLSDEFDDASTLTSWQDHAAVEGWPSQIEAMDINTTRPGSLMIMPYTSGWYADFRGVFLFKEVTGDFIATIRVKATGRERDVPRSSFSLAGVMARAPRTVTPATWEEGKENWVFITTGYGDGEIGQPQTETKTTMNGKSILHLDPSRTGWVNLGVMRIGEKFIMLVQFEGEGWKISDIYTRPDMPATLQVGINAYTDWLPIRTRYETNPAAFNNTVIKGDPSHPDLIAEYDYIHFVRPQISEEIAAKIAAGKMTQDDWLALVGE
jgi:hypothetical protein